MEWSSVLHSHVASIIYTTDISVSAKVCPHARYKWEKEKYSAVTLQSFSQSGTIHISLCDCQDVYHDAGLLGSLSFREALYCHALRVSFRLLSLFQHPWGCTFIGSCPIGLPSRMTSNVSLIRAAYKYLNTPAALTHGLCSKTLVSCPAVSGCLLRQYLNWNRTSWVTDLECSASGFWDNQKLIENTFLILTQFLIWTEFELREAKLHFGFGFKDTEF